MSRSNILSPDQYEISRGIWSYPRLSRDMLPDPTSLEPNLLVQTAMLNYLGRESVYDAGIVNRSTIEKLTYQGGKEKTKIYTYLYDEGFYQIFMKNKSGERRSWKALFDDYCRVLSHIFDRELFGFDKDVKTVGWYKRYESIVYLYKELMKEGVIWNGFS